MSRIIMQPIGKITKKDFIDKKNISWAEQNKYNNIWKDSIGDTVLFTKDREIISIARINAIEEDYKKNKAYPLRYYWNEDIYYTDIPLKKINKIIGYKETFFPQHYMVIKDINIDEVFLFLEKIESIKKDIEIKELTKTEKEVLIKLRVGQSKYREELIKYWGGCSVTQYKDIKFLTASHIKPWKDSTDIEKLDVYNGLLLLPNLDKLFDRGYISFNDNGTILISEQLKDIEILGLNKKMKIDIENEHKKYLEFHRKNIFR